MQNRDEFSSYLIENFSESLSKYGERKKSNLMFMLFVESCTEFSGFEMRISPDNLWFRSSRGYGVLGAIRNDVRAVQIHMG